MSINRVNCHSEERSRPQAGVATKNLLSHLNEIVHVLAVRKLQ